jgi:hypothetical protein
VGAVASSAFAQPSALVYVDPVDIAQLKAECQTNPNNYSYTDPVAGTKTLQQWFLAGDDTIVAAILNQTRAGITIYRSDVAPNEVKEAIAVNQLTTSATAAIAAVQAAWLNAFFNGDPVRLKTKAGADSRALSNLMVLLTNASASETRVRALAERTGTRAEQLWGCTTNNDAGCEYVTVTTDHVVRARQLP